MHRSIRSFGIEFDFSSIRYTFCDAQNEHDIYSEEQQYSWYSDVGDRMSAYDNEIGHLL